MNNLGDTAQLADWRPLFAMLAVYAAIVVALVVTGKQRKGFGPTYVLPRISSSLERLTGIPGWAAAAVGTASFGLLVAGMGFYNDVAWHVALGRDKVLFTAPHTAIIIGLFLIFTAAVVGTVMARLDRVEVGLRIRGLRIPWSMLALGLFGGAALAGFPLDELWHRFYGIDVTMWSPTHLLMILGAAFSPFASWLALAEARVRPTDGRWQRGVYVAVAVMTLLGLTAAQGEFSFGVPQFQQLYHPILIVLAAGIALTATRLVIGRWWALVVAVIGVGIGTGNLFGRAQISRPAAVYVACALAVELAALLFGTERRLRFAVVSGVGIATIGLAGEWAWNRGAFQSWTAALLPDALVLGVIAAVCAAVIGVAFGDAVRGRRAMRGGVVALAGLGVLFCLAWPLPRTGLDARAQVSLQHVPGGVTVTARVDPPDAARNARWFQAMAWQGGGMVAVDMKEKSRGVYVSERPVPVDGSWKTVLRIQKGTATASIPIWFPRDAAIGKPEIAAADRTAPFELEQKYLLREQHAGAGWFAPLVYAALLTVALLWIAAVVIAARNVSVPEPTQPTRQELAAA
ncbi:MAG: hypothetical protein M3282_11870 [Gemmatimonadota bacterium]|nr:hypothetical protein [Gemmatimonadota bacterium]